MPWRTNNLLQAREEFVKLADAGDQYFSRLYRSFGISFSTLSSQSSVECLGQSFTTVTMDR